MNGFGNRDREYSLRIQHPEHPHHVRFTVAWEGTLRKTDQRAIGTATAAWTIVKYGKEGYNAYAEILKHLDAESCDNLVELHELLKGERFIGKVRSHDGFCLMAFASHTGMIPGVRQYEALDIVKQLA